MQNTSLPITQLPGRFDVREAVAQIQARPQVWNRHSLRQRAYAHAQIDDIWVRYNAWKNFSGDMQAFNGPHQSEWYPVVEEIPAVRALVEEVQARIPGRLGGVLITRIPAGGECKPHRDGGWHATFYEKFAVQLASAPGQAFCFEEASLSAEPGEWYTFDNSKLHWVTNHSAEARMTLIICIRRAPCLGD